MSKFCENCKQDVEPRTPAGAIMRYVLMFIFLPIVTSIMVEIYGIDWTVGFWFGILGAIMGTAYRTIFEKDKKCPMCNDKRFRKIENLITKEVRSGTEESHKNPSILAYAMPILLGIIGGVIGYVMYRKESPYFAKKLLFVGLMSGAVWMVYYIISDLNTPI